MFDVENSLKDLLKEVRACRICEAELPLGPRPVLRAESTARILIVGQAPGTKVHETGVPWNDASGDRLRQWLGLERETFYDASRVAIIPMGFCYPGRDARGGDLPPRKECAQHWIERLLAHLPHIETTLLVGMYAQRPYLGDRVGENLTETVQRWRHYWPEHVPLPHPSWRNTAWLRRNPWFEQDLLPCLRERVRALVASPKPQ